MKLLDGIDFLQQRTANVLKRVWSNVARSSSSEIETSVTTRRGVKDLIDGGGWKMGDGKEIGGPLPRS